MRNDWLVQFYLRCPLTCTLLVMIPICLFVFTRADTPAPDAGSGYTCVLPADTIPPEAPAPVQPEAPVPAPAPVQTPAFEIQTLTCPQLNRPAATFITPVGWDVATKIEWAGPVWQPVHWVAGARVRTEDGIMGAATLPTWTPDPNRLHETIVRNRSDVLAHVIRVSGFDPDDIRDANYHVTNTETIPGATFIFVTVRLIAKEGGVESVTYARALLVDAGNFATLVEVAPTIMFASEEIGLANVIPLLFPIIASFQPDDAWFIEFWKATRVAGDLSEMTRLRNRSYDAANKAWADTIKGVSEYTINGRRYYLPGNYRYGVSGTTIYVETGSALPPGVEVTPDPIFPR